MRGNARTHDVKHADVAWLLLAAAPPRKRQVRHADDPVEEPGECELPPEERGSVSAEMRLCVIATQRTFASASRKSWLSLGVLFDVTVSPPRSSRTRVTSLPASASLSFTAMSCAALSREALDAVVTTEASDPEGASSNST